MNIQAAVDEFKPFLHAENARASAVLAHGAFDADTIVLHAEQVIRRRFVKPDAANGGLAMFDDIGYGLFEAHAHDVFVELRRILQFGIPFKHIRDRSGSQYLLGTMQLIDQLCAPHRGNHLAHFLECGRRGLPQVVQLRFGLIGIDAQQSFGQIGFQADQGQLLTQRVVQIPRDALPLFHFHQLIQPFIGALQLIFELFALVFVIHVDGQQDGGHETDKDERQLAEQQGAAVDNRIVHRHEHGHEMNQIEGNEAGPVFDRSDKKGQKQREIRIIVNNGHRDGDGNQQSDPHVNLPSPSDGGQQITGKENQNHHNARNHRP
ncbi:hypothetical protein D1872_233400 [compost metagenome]